MKAENSKQLFIMFPDETQALLNATCELGPLDDWSRAHLYRMYFLVRADGEGHTQAFTRALQQAEHYMKHPGL